jgi:hypothetical protein
VLNESQRRTPSMIEVYLSGAHPVLFGASCVNLEGLVRAGRRRPRPRLARAVSGGSPATNQVAIQ